MATWRSVTNTLRRRRLYVWTLLTLCLIMAICVVLSTNYLDFQQNILGDSQTTARSDEIHRTTKKTEFVELSNFLESQVNANTIRLVKSQNLELKESTNINGVSRRKQKPYSNSDIDQTIINGTRLKHLGPQNIGIAHALLTKRRINVTKQHLRNESAPDETDGKEQTIVMSVPSWSEIHKDVDNVSMGGRHTPTKGHPQDTVVFIVSYRNRRLHLKLFLKHMHPFLQRQNLGYVIYVVEMEDDVPFKKTVLYNAGFLEIMKRENTSCLVFHDIDMLPTNDKNLYFCDNTVRHYAVAVQQFKYRLLYSNFVGGVLAFPTKYYRAVNGFSNLYMGWGAEDDDMWKRIRASKIRISRPTKEIGRYDSWSHDRDTLHYKRNKALLVNGKRRMKWDGLNSVRYQVKAFEERPLFTWILIQTSFKSYEQNISRNNNIHDNGKGNRLGDDVDKARRKDHQIKVKKPTHKNSGILK